MNLKQAKPRKTSKRSIYAAEYAVWRHATVHGIVGKTETFDEFLARVRPRPSPQHRFTRQNLHLPFSATNGAWTTTIPEQEDNPTSAVDLQGQTFGTVMVEDQRTTKPELWNALCMTCGASFATPPPSPAKAPSCPVCVKPKQVRTPRPKTAQQALQARRSKLAYALKNLKATPEQLKALDEAEDTEQATLDMWDAHQKAKREARIKAHIEKLKAQL